MREIAGVYIYFIRQPEGCLLYRTYDSFHYGYFRSTAVFYTRDRCSDLDIIPSALVSITATSIDCNTLR